MIITDRTFIPKVRLTDLPYGSVFKCSAPPFDSVYMKIFMAKMEIKDNNPLLVQVVDLNSGDVLYIDESNYVTQLFANLILDSFYTKYPEESKEDNE